MYMMTEKHRFCERSGNFDFSSAHCLLYLKHWGYGNSNPAIPTPES